MKPRSNSFLRNTAIAASIVLCLGQPIDAGILTWDGSDTVTSGAQGGAGTWNVNSTANWWNGTTDLAWPALGGTDDDAVFGGTAGTVTLGSAITANDLTFNTTGYILSGAQTLTLNGATPTITTASGVTATIGNGTATVLAGSVGLIKAGAGTLILNGSAVNTFTGGLNIKGGTLTLDFTNLATPTNLINSGNALTLGGGTLSILGKNVAAATSAQTFGSTTLASGGSVVSLNKGSSATSVTLNLGQVTVNPGAVVIFNPNTAWTTTASTTEKVFVTTGGSITVPGTGTAYANAGIMYGTGTGTRWAQVNSSGQLVGAPTASTWVTSGANAANVYNAGTTATQTMAASQSMYGIIANHTSGVQHNLGSATNGYTLTTNGILNINSGLLTLAPGTTPGILQIGSEKSLVINAAQSGGVTISAAIANNGANASNVTVNSTGAGVTTLSGANTYSGITTISSGTLAISLGASETNGASSSALGAIPGSATSGKLVFNGGTLSVTPSGAISMASNRGILVNAGGGTITNTAGQTLTLSSIIAGTGAMTFNVSNSSGGFSIGGTNTFSGGATLGGSGTFFVLNNSAFGTGSLTLNGAQIRSSTGAASNLANTVTIAANTTFVSVASEQNLIFSGAATLTGNRTLTANVGTNVAGRNVTFSGGISEDVAGRALTKAGTGTLTLSGASTYTGTTTVSAGRLALTKNTALYNNDTGSWTAANITVANGATLALNVGSGGTDFSSANIDTLAALGTATTGFVSGSYLGLDSTSGDFTYASDLANPNSGANAIGVIKLGANKLTLSGNNSYTGITMIGGGTLVAGSTSAFGATGKNVYFMTTPAAGTSGTQLAGGNLELATDSSVNTYNLNGTSSFSSTLTLNRATTGAGITQNLGNWVAGNSTLTVAKGANVTSGTATVSFTGMSLGAGSGGNSTLTPTDTNISITGAVNSTTNSAKTLILDGNIAGNSISGDITNGSNVLSLTKSGASTWTLSGINTYTGTTTVSAGTLVLSGTNTGAGATNVIGGTLQAGAALAFNPNSAVTMTDAAAAVLDLNGYSNSIGSLAGGGGTGGNVTLGAGTLTTGGDNTSTAYAGNISGNGGLTKTGSGVFTLSSAQGYLGATAVNVGSLIVNNTLASSGVTVGNNATLGGTGNLTNSVFINSGGTLSAATATTAGTLTMGSLTLDAGSLLSYEFGGTSDLISVSTAGGLTINGGALSLYAAGGVAALSTNGTYSLINYSGALGGAFTNLTVGNSQAGKVYSLNDTGSVIQLTLADATSSVWGNGNSNELWSDSGNWSGGVPNSTGALATFNIAGSAVTVVGAKTVGSIVFDNATGYTLSGDTINLDNGIASGAIGVTSGNHVINAPIALISSGNITPASGTTLTLGGTISGTKAVIYSGAGTTALTGSNSYSGTTTISAGTLTIGDGGTTGSLSTGSGITNNATLAFNRSNTLTQGTDFASVISGTGTISQTGSGTTVLNGANTYSGATTASAGALNIQNNTALGTTTGATSVTAGAALQVQGGLTAMAENLTLNGTGVSNDGALRSISGANTLSGTVALGSTGVRINSDTAATALTLSNAAGITGTGFNLTVGGAGDTVISGGIKTGAAATLTKDGNGTLTLAGANTYTGATTISAGSLLLQGGVGYATSGFAIASNAVLELNTSATTGYSTATFSGAGTLRKSGTGTTNWTGPIATFALDSDSLIDVQGGIFTGGSNANDVWTSNKSDLNVAGGALFETVEANVRVDALSGSGVIATGYSGSGYSALTIGVDSGNGTFTGTLASGHSTGNITKIGTGTQTFTGAGGTYTGNLTLTDGVFSIDTIANGGLSTTLTTTAGSNTATVGSAAGLEVGMAVWANNNAQRTIVPYGTTITGISGNTITLSSNAVVNGSAISGAAFGFGNGLGIGTNTAARLVFNGGTLQYTGATASTDRNFTINTGKTAMIDVSNSAVNLTISGSSTVTTGALTKIGNGTLTLSGNNAYTGLTTVSSGALNITSTGSLNSGNALTVESNGTADFANVGQTLGAVSNANTATNALNFSANTGIVTLASLTGAGNTRFGSNGAVTGGISAGTVSSVGALTANISGGTITAGGLLTGNISSGSVNAQSLSSSSVIGGTINIAAAASITTLSGGTTTIGGLATIGAMSAGTANLNGATSSISTLNGGTLNLGSSTALSVNDGTTSGSIAGIGGSLTKSSTGTLTLSGTSTYTGATTVSAGTLIVNGNISTSSLTTVQSGATLGGSGTLGDLTIAAGGTHNPGNSPGIMNTGDYTMAGTLNIEAVGNTPGAGGYDQVNTTGTVNLSGTLATSFTGGTYANGDLLFILLNDDVDAINGTFSGLAQNAFVINYGGFDWKISYTANGDSLGSPSFTGGNDVALMAVPEPNVAVLLGGLGTLALMRRRRSA